MTTSILSFTCAMIYSAAALAQLGQIGLEGNRFVTADGESAHIPFSDDETCGKALAASCADGGIPGAVWVFDPRWAPMLINERSFGLTRQGGFLERALPKKLPQGRQSDFRNT